MFAFWLCCLLVWASLSLPVSALALGTAVVSWAVSQPARAASQWYTEVITRRLLTFLQSDARYLSAVKIPHCFSPSASCISLSTHTGVWLLYPNGGLCNCLGLESFNLSRVLFPDFPLRFWSEVHVELYLRAIFRWEYPLWWWERAVGLFQCPVQLWLGGGRHKPDHLKQKYWEMMFLGIVRNKQAYFLFVYQLSSFNLSACFLLLFLFKMLLCTSCTVLPVSHVTSP